MGRQKPGHSHRRTAEQRIATKDDRSSAAYLARIAVAAREEERARQFAEVFGEDLEVSETPNKKGTK